MPRKNKPPNPFTFRANADPGGKCEKWKKGLEMWKKRREIPRYKPATDDLREVHEMRETHEKKGRTWNNAKIDYTRFTIRLFFRTIKFYLLLHEKIPLSRA